MRLVPEGALMQQAATGLAVRCMLLLRSTTGGVVGRHVALLVGSGNNGGDALWAGARLAARGARVDAVLLSGQAHEEGLHALRRAGGRAWPAGGDDEAGSVAESVILAADLVCDGIVGIGASGPLRPRAARLAAAATESGAVVVAVDLPSGIDPDTGAVADHDAVVTADVTVTFGAMKSGLLLMPAAEHVGLVSLVDIGLGPYLPAEPDLRVPTAADLAWLLPEPGPADHKYTRGVVGVAAGSARYRGAAHLAVGGARRGDVGMVHYLGRDAGLAAEVVAAAPDVVVVPDVEGDGRVSAWLAGPGMGQSDDDAAALRAVLGTPGPVLLDADALSLMAADPGIRALVEARGRDGRVTVITPHDGEFARLGFAPGTGADADRAGAARAAARSLGAVVLLKGARTVVASPSGAAWVCPAATPALATAGSGDVLSGLAAAMLAHAAAVGPLDGDGAARVVAAAATVHGRAGELAGEGGRPVTAADVVAAVPDAIAEARG